MTELLAILKRWFTSTGDKGIVHGRGEPVTAPAWHVEHRDNCTVYRGPFVIYSARGQLLWQVWGRIVEWPGLPAEVYSCDPPSELRQHLKGPCLQRMGPGSSWFKLHWEKPARDFDSSRAYVEQLLDEALRWLSASASTIGT